MVFIKVFVIHSFIFRGTKTKKHEIPLTVRLLRFHIRIILVNSDIAIANYIDDNTPHVWSPGLHSIISKPQKNTGRIFSSFHNSNLISNAGKSQVIVNSKENLEIEVSS